MIQQKSGSALNDVTMKRRAVYTALQPFFDMKQVLEALWHWEDNYASDHKTSIRKFINEICVGDMKDKANAMYHNLMLNLQDRNIELDEDPYSLMLAYRGGKLQFAEPKSEKLLVLTPPMVVFNRLLQGFMEQLASIEHYYEFKVREYVGENVGEYSHELDLQQVNEIRVWMKYREGELEYNYNPKQMSRVLHLLYIAACEFFGPTVADKCLSQAVNAVERIPEARQFAPKQIL
ncbi:MAG: hypothetical protein HUJ29_01705 [Gammaproteobacteria bacterium]|nr:hypothetical protein [Gammaproteobacteria bacterium]